MEECFPCSTFLPSLAVIFVVDLNHSDRYKMEFQSSFDLYFLMAKGVEHSF